MTFRPQHIEAPDGTALVVITRDEYDRLRTEIMDEDARDVLAADAARAEGDLRYPAAVVDAMLAGDPPIAAWRKHRDYSQRELANRAGLSQAGVCRLEAQRDGAPASLGRLATRRAIARALEVPPSALDPLND